MATYAYARVSAYDQNLDRQIDAFINYGVNRDHIYTDKKSGKDFNRTSYNKLIKKLKKDDLLIIKSIDRLGRNYDDIICEWSKITNKIQADILVLDMPLLDTRTKSHTLIGKFISDIVLQILSFVAENERTNIKARQKEGIKAAQSRGVKFGRPSTPYSQEFVNVSLDFYNHNISIEQAIKLTQLKRCNFYYHMHKVLKLLNIEN